MAPARRASSALRSPSLFFLHQRMCPTLRSAHPATRHCTPAALGKAWDLPRSPTTCPTFGCVLLGTAFQAQGHPSVAGTYGRPHRLHAPTRCRSIGTMARRSAGARRGDGKGDDSAAGPAAARKPAVLASAGWTPEATSYPISSARSPWRNARVRPRAGSGAAA